MNNVQLTRDRVLTVHAGTHKTASTYIQSRLLANAKILAKAGVFTDYPQEITRKFKPLVAALQAGDWSAWKLYLQMVPAHCNHILVSAEQFSQSLANPKIFKPLTKLLLKHGYRTKIIVFLRDQPDYTNAHFVHSTRRLYHHMPFNDYVDMQLNECKRFYDYEYLFGSLIKEPGIQIDFLPYLSSLGDPFERLMRHLGFKPNTAWKSHSEGAVNIQPGHKGVWLAQEISKQLFEQYGIIDGKGSPLKNRGTAVRRIAEREGWAKDRYYGFDEAMFEKVVENYAESNDRFAQDVWGCSWRKVYPLHRLDRQVYELPASGTEHTKMLALTQEALDFIVDEAMFKTKKHWTSLFLN